MAFAALKELGPEKVARIDEMLKKGIVTGQVATIIHDEWKVLTDVKHPTLKRMLERYRKGELRERIVAEIAGATEGTRTSTLQKRVNALDALDELVALQTARYKKMLVKEQAGPLLMKQVSDEGRLLKEMLVELGRLQLETGVLARAPKKVTGSVTDAAGQVSTFEWTTEQEELFKTLDEGRGSYVALA